jgi:ribosome-binding factor A
MNTRLERVAQTIRDAIAGILLRDIHDPLIGFVTITDVKVSPDLRHARVFFSVLGTPEQVKDSIKGILRARKHINALLADHVDMRFIPKLQFVYDETAAKAQRMMELLREEQGKLGADLARHEAEDRARAETEAAAAAEAGDAGEPDDGEHDDELDDGEDDEDFDDEFAEEDTELEDFDGDDEEDEA